MRTRFDFDPERVSVSEIIGIVALVCHVSPLAIIHRRGPLDVRTARHLVCRLAWDAGYPPRTIAERISHHTDTVEASLRTTEKVLGNGTPEAAKLGEILGKLRWILGIREAEAEREHEEAA